MRHTLLPVLPLILIASLDAQLLENPNVSQLFPSDVVERAKLFIKNIPGGVGAYR